MLSCLGFPRRHRQDGEREPLLSQHDDTSRQALLREKLHSYQMLRALSQGYMPSTQQAVAHLSILLSADALDPDAPGLSRPGRALVGAARLWLSQLADLLQDRNADDQIQDLVWHLAKARLDVDAADVGARAAASKAKADASAAAASLRTVGSLLLANDDFRALLADLGTIGRLVLRDTASTLADVSRQASEQLKPSTEAAVSPKHADGSPEREAGPSKRDLEEQVDHVAHVVSTGAAQVAGETGHSLAQHVGSDEQPALIHHLKQAIASLRQRNDYSESASTLSLLLQRHLAAYTRLAPDTIRDVEEDVGANREADEAVRNFWHFLTSLGDRQLWDRVEEAFHNVVDAGRSDPGFDRLVRELANLVQDMLTDPEFLDSAEERFGDVRAKAKDMTSRSSVAEGVDRLLQSLDSALRSAVHDGDVQKLVHTSMRIMQILSPQGQYVNSELLSDCINVFVPLAARAMQYLPVPRLEVSTPTTDLLLESLVLEPGRSIYGSSFLPHRLHISTQTDIEVQVGQDRSRTTSWTTSLLRVRVDGLSIAANDLGYWLRLHWGPLRVEDEGVASFHLDERGVNIALDVEIGRGHMDELLAVRGVDVRIHHLSYSLRGSKSRFALVAWALKPLLRPMVRRALEARIACAVEAGVRASNRELVFARERLRATRIADPADVRMFARAVAARLAPAPGPAVEPRPGLRAGRGAFRGPHAPGGLARLWQDEEQRVRGGEHGRGGWRSAVFDPRAQG